MKTIRFTLVLIVLALLVPVTKSLASIEVTASAARTEMVRKVAGQQKHLAKAIKAEKKAKFKLFAKKSSGVDFNDPVDKWMWFWIFGWGAGLLLSILGAAIATGSVYGSGFGVAALLLTLSWLAWLFGTVALVIWLVKKFG